MTPTNDVPVVTDDTYHVGEDGSLAVVRSAGVLANDQDADGQNTLSAQLVATSRDVAAYQWRARLLRDAREGKAGAGVKTREAGKRRRNRVAPLICAADASRYLL